MPRRDRADVSQGLSQILGGSDATDLLGSVIQSDRRRTGRVAEKDSLGASSEGQTSDPPDTTTSHTVSGQYDSKTISQSDHRTSGRDLEQDTGDLLNRRVAEAKRMADGDTMTVTLRIPRELNEWLDEYIHRAWPERVRKQDLVTEGLRLVFARRGRPGEPVLHTGLLPEESP
jgi:hypothetical protein